MGKWDMVGMSPEVAMGIMKLGMAAKEHPLDQAYKQALIDQIRSAIPRHGEELNLRRQQLQQTQQHHADTLQLSKEQLQLHRDQFDEQKKMNVAIDEGRVQAAEIHKERIKEIQDKRAAIDMMSGVAIDVQGNKVPLSALERAYPGSVNTILKHQYKDAEGVGGITIPNLTNMQDSIMRKYAVEGDKTINDQGQVVFGGTLMKRLQESARDNPEAFDDLKAYNDSEIVKRELLGQGRGKVKLGGSQPISQPVQQEPMSPKPGKQVPVPGQRVYKILPDGRKVWGVISPDGKSVTY